MIRPVTITDGVTTFDLLTYRLEKSVQQACRHVNRVCRSTSESGSKTCFAEFYCYTCKATFTEELLPSEYRAMLEDYERGRAS